MYPCQDDVQTLGSVVVGVKFYPTNQTTDDGGPRPRRTTTTTDDDDHDDDRLVDDRERTIDYRLPKRGLKTILDSDYSR